MMENVKLLIKKSFLYYIAPCVYIGMYAQSGISIKGTVVDKNNEAIIGASVVNGRAMEGLVPYQIFQAISL